MTLVGILRRGFLRGGSRVHIAKAHLSSEQVRDLAWSSWRKLGKSLLRLPLDGAVRALSAACSASRMPWASCYAWAGMRYDYYLRRRG